MENSNATVVIENHLSHEKLSFYEENYFSVQFHEHHIGGKCIIAPKKPFVNTFFEKMFKIYTNLYVIMVQIFTLKGWMQYDQVFFADI